jgi:TPR repeat protein
MWAAVLAITGGLVALGPPAAFPAEGSSAGDAMRLLERAGSEGNSEALLRLGDLYFGGSLVPADFARAFSYYQRAANTGSSTAKLRIGEMLVRGQGVEQDIERGRALVREVAESGNPKALVVLGNLYSAGDHSAIDATAAADAFEKAVALGDSEALLLLGDLFSEGEIVAVDMARAFGYYERAAAAGSDTAKTLVAAMTVRGEGTVANVDRGLDTLRTLADAGNAGALVALGDIYARGDAGSVDAAAAISLFEKAAAIGSTQALMRLGAAFSYGVIVRADGKRAADYYRRAADAGAIEARFALARGYTENGFDGVASAAEGIEILEEFAKAGMPDAVSALSDCYLYGLGVSRNPNRAVAMLEESMRNGNLEAALDLVDMYREGRMDRGMRLIRQNLSLARSYLDKIKERLSYSRLAYEEGLLDAAGGRRTETYQRIYDDMGILPPSLRSAMVRDLRTVNPNAYVYLVQSQLEKRGSYQGKKSGVLDGSTVRAINEYCAQRGAKDLCRFGPMSGPTAELLSFAF